MKRFKKPTTPPSDVSNGRSTPRLSDVAAAAGVSLGTASNVFNHPDRVRPEVRDLVHSAALSLGYGGPDPKGRLLMGGRANAIGVLPPGNLSVATAFRSPYFREFMSGIAEICEEEGASVVLFSGSDSQKETAIRNAVVDGFVLGHVEDVGLMAVRQRRVPFVVMDMDAGADVNSVRIAAYEGARQAARHLLALGHRDLAIMGVLRQPMTAVFHAAGDAGRDLVSAYPIDEEKLAGYRDALAEAGIALRDVPIVQSYTPTPWAEEGARLLLDRAPNATGILAMADKLAIALIDEAARRGIAVPEKLSIIGFDDAPDAATARPPLTTIRQPIVEKGRIAARLVFEGAEGQHKVLPIELVQRATTAPPGG